MSKVIVWLKEAYKLDDEDAKYIAGLAADGNTEAVEAAFIPENASDTECAVIATEVSGLMAGYKKLTKPSKQKPEPKPLVEMSPSPNVDIHQATAEKVMSGVGGTPGAPIKPDVSSHTTTIPEINIVIDESDDKKPQGKEPEVRTTDLSVPPEYPLSHNMGINQIRLLRKLVASVTVLKGVVVFDKFDSDSGGIPLDDARPGFGTLLMRGGICEVVDAVMIKGSGKKYWGKRVVPIMPMAKQVIADYKKRKPDKWALLK